MAPKSGQTVTTTTGRTGTFTGGSRGCRCGRGPQYAVRWSDGKLAYLCVRVLTEQPGGTYTAEL